MLRGVTPELPTEPLHWSAQASQSAVKDSFIDKTSSGFGAAKRAGVSVDVCTLSPFTPLVWAAADEQLTGTRVTVALALLLCTAWVAMRSTSSSFLLLPPTFPLYLLSSCPNVSEENFWMSRIARFLCSATSQRISWLFPEAESFF